MNIKRRNCTKPLWILVGLLFIFLGCTSEKKKVEQPKSKIFSLDDFYAENTALDKVIDSAFQALDDKSRISQMIVVAAGTTGKPNRTVENLIKSKLVGGILMLSGEKE